MTAQVQTSQVPTLFSGSASFQSFSVKAVGLSLVALASLISAEDVQAASPDLGQDGVVRLAPFDNNLGNFDRSCIDVEITKDFSGSPYSLFQNADGSPIETYSIDNPDNCPVGSLEITMENPSLGYHQPLSSSGRFIEGREVTICNFTPDEAYYGPLFLITGDNPEPEPEPNPVLDGFQRLGTLKQAKSSNKENSFVVPHTILSNELFFLYVREEGVAKNPFALKSVCFDRLCDVFEASKNGILLRPDVEVDGNVVKFSAPVEIDAGESFSLKAKYYDGAWDNTMDGQKVARVDVYIPEFEGAAEPSLCESLAELETRPNETHFNHIKVPVGFKADQLSFSVDREAIFNAAVKCGKPNLCGLDDAEINGLIVDPFFVSGRNNTEFMPDNSYVFNDGGEIRIEAEKNPDYDPVEVFACE